MKRRDFLKIARPLAASPLLLQGMPIRTFASPTMLARTCEASERVLVTVYLNGANDFVNTFVPLDQHSVYAGHRPNIYIPTSNLITLDSTLSSSQQLGLHPSLTPFKSLYDSGKLSVIQGVGMPDPNRSHFKAQDLWLRGGDGTSSALSNLDTGWIGRFLDNRYPSFQGVPFSGEPDPLGILLGRMINSGFHTPEEHRFEINLSGQDPGGFYSLISSIGGPPIINFPDSDHGDMLRHIMAIENSVNVYAERISDTFNAGSNSSTAYPDNDLADQLKTVARMLNGGSQTKVFMATQSGYDTHVFQVDDGSVTTGRHADLLGDMSQAIQAFQNDITALGLADKVLTVVFSEFGRKVVQNGTFGLDHGTLGSMVLIGNGVEGGVMGNNIDLNDLDAQNAPTPGAMQHDYREVFGSVLQDWMGANDQAVEATFLTSSYISPKLPLIDPSAAIGPDCSMGSVTLEVNAKVFLRGPYDTGTNTMKDDLRVSGDLPTIEPYTALGFSPENSNAQIDPMVMAVNHPTDSIVDWVLIELRDSSSPSTVVNSISALVRRDGNIVHWDDGTSGITFRNLVAGAQYEVAIRHRNHLGVMSGMAIDVN